MDRKEALDGKSGLRKEALLKARDWAEDRMHCSLFLAHSSGKRLVDAYPCEVEVVRPRRLLDFNLCEWRYDMLRRADRSCLYGLGLHG